LILEILGLTKSTSKTASFVQLSVAHHYSEEMKQLDALKRELLLMKEKTQNTPERDAA